MDPSPSLAISIPCPRATSPGRSYCVHLLCVSSSLIYPFCTRALDYSVAPPIQPFLPCLVPRVPAFPSAVPNASSGGGPSSFGFVPCESTYRVQIPYFYKVRLSALRRLRHRHHPAIGSKPSAALDTFKLPGRLANTSTGFAAQVIPGKRTCEIGQSSFSSTLYSPTFALDLGRRSTSLLINS